jgi:MoxR-like ATPase
MKLSQLERLIKCIAEKQIHRPVTLVGESGVGKSSILQQVADDLKIGYIDLRAATQEAGDLIGLPDKSGDKTVWLNPQWWPEVGTRGILVLEELNRAPTEIRQCFFQLLTEWKMHQHTLPSGWVIFAAINPDGTKAGYQVEGLDPAMINRMALINVELSVDDWLTWAHKNKVHAAVIGFIASHKELLHKVKESGAWPSPRSWHGVSDFLKAEIIEENMMTDVVSGLVGNESAATFCQWMRKNYEKPVSAEEVLDGYTKDISTRVRNQSRSANNATALDMASMLTSIFKADKKLTEKQKDAVRKFALDLGGYGDKNKKEADKHDDVIVAFLKRIPSPQLSLEIICDTSPEAELLSSMFNEINTATEIAPPTKKTR